MKSLVCGFLKLVVFDQKECVFLTRLTAMQATQRLKILNSDPVGHNTKLEPRANSMFDRTIVAGGSDFDQPQAEEREPFSVSCAIHPWMKAWVITRSNSYFAVTGPDGSFEIPNLPAGVELEFRTWHEKSKFVQNVSVNGSKEKWSKGKFSRTLQDGETLELSVAVDAAELN